MGLCAHRCLAPNTPDGYQCPNPDLCPPMLAQPSGADVKAEGIWEQHREPVLHAFPSTSSGKLLQNNPLPLGQPPVLPSQEECSPTSRLSLEAGSTLSQKKGMHTKTLVTPGPHRAPPSIAGRWGLEARAALPACHLLGVLIQSGLGGQLPPASGPHL